jgi:hypothetical protein
LVTKRRAEALTGYEIRCAEIGRPVRRFVCAAYDGDMLVAEEAHADQGLALAALVRAVYRRNREQVMEHSGWRCARCGGTSWLQVHHRRFRSHGGTYQPENLEPVCWPCHRRIHRSERSK